MKKFFCFLFLLIFAISLTACVKHDDGVCDVKDCSATIGVIRYDEDHELCLSHAANYDSSTSDGHGSDDNNYLLYVSICIVAIIIVSIFIAIFVKSLSRDDDSENPQTDNKCNQPTGETELRKYKSLLDEGLITQEDYDKKKNEILHL